MNFLLLKQISINSAIAGAVLAIISLIPYLNIFSTALLFLFLGAAVLVYMKQRDEIGIFDIKEGAVFGAIIGFVSFLAFAIIYIPVDMILGLLPFHNSYLVYFFNNFGGVIVLLMLVVFIAFLSALMNGFAGLCTSYVYELISGIKKNENETVDFEIK